MLVGDDVRCIKAFASAGIAFFCRHVFQTSIIRSYEVFNKIKTGISPVLFCVVALTLGSLRSTTRQLHDAVSIYMIRKSFLEFDGFNDRLKLAYSSL